jgi:hypothetical protein
MEGDLDYSPGRPQAITQHTERAMINRSLNKLFRVLTAIG